MTQVFEFEKKIIIIFRFRTFTRERYLPNNEEKLFLSIRDYVLQQLIKKNLHPLLKLSYDADDWEELHEIHFERPNNWNQIKDSLLL